MADHCNLAFKDISEAGARFEGLGHATQTALSLDSAIAEKS